MPYTQVTLQNLTDQLGVLLDDQNEKYWVVQEKQYAVWEALRVFGALTNYWRSRGSFPVSSSQPWNLPQPWSPSVYPWQNQNVWYDLSVVLPTLRTRTWTLGQMCQEIQYMCLEAANGTVAGTGMSGQLTVTNILNAIQRARNRFVLDAHLPITVVPALNNPAPPNGQVFEPENSVFIHRVSWQDIPTGTWANLWREDAWSVDHANPNWILEPGMPQQYSEAENAPLQIQLSPEPINAGVAEYLSVLSLQMNLTTSTSTFNIPDEWVHAVKYAALADLFSSESQIVDPLRAQYAEMRYQQAIGFAKDARSLMRIAVNGVPFPLDSMAALDAGNPTWRNQTGRPQVAGSLYDLVTFNPGIQDQVYGLSADVVQSAPLPQAGNAVQLGSEDIDNIVNYASHVLTFKCGGNEFKQTMPNYDAFMKSVALRKGVNAAKIRYLQPLFGQPNVEWQLRPDRMEAHA